MGDLNIKVTEAIMAIEKNTELFYQQKEKEGFKLLGNTIDALNLAVDKVYQYKKNCNNEIVDEDKLNKLLINTMEALQIKDTILLADILEYEVKNLFEEILEKLNNE